MTNKYPGVQVLPEHVDDVEKLARCIFNSKSAKRQKVTLNAFDPPKKENALGEQIRVREISVDRFDYLNMEGAIQLGQLREKHRTGHFWGWAIIFAEHARGKGRNVAASPSEVEGNPAHADIILPASATTNEEDRKEHLKALAEQSIWRGRPDYE